MSIPNWIQISHARSPENSYDRKMEEAVSMDIRASEVDIWYRSYLPHERTNLREWTIRNGDRRINRLLLHRQIPFAQFGSKSSFKGEKFD